MTITWGSPLKQKYLMFVWGSEWERSDFKPIECRKTPLGWAMNIWRLSISYDNDANIKPRE